MPLSTIFQLINIMAVSFIGGGNQSARRKQQAKFSCMTVRLLDIMHNRFYLLGSQLTRRIHIHCHWPVHVYASFILVIVWSFWVEANLWRFFLFFIHICIYQWRSNYQKKLSCHPIIQFNPATFLCLFQADLDFDKHVKMFCFQFPVFAHFVDTGGIANYSHFNFLSMINYFTFY